MTGYHRLLLCLTFLACAGCPFDGDDGSAGPAGPPGPPGVVIHSIIAVPPVLRPNETTTLTVSASDGAGSTLTYSWQSLDGTLGLPIGNTVAWTAPNSVGPCTISVTAGNPAGSVAVGMASILVTAAPTGPIITSVNPSPIDVGGEITITGAGFGASQGTSTVIFNGSVAATATSWSDAVVKAIVPDTAQTGSVEVHVSSNPSSPGSLVVLWNRLHPGNVPICTHPSRQFGVVMTADGAGGAILLWPDERNAGIRDIYAQRVDEAGNPLWAADGVPVVVAPGEEWDLRCVSDGAGGVIAVWTDQRHGSGRIYGQRLNSSGVPQWPLNGLLISPSSTGASVPEAISDGLGGVILSWRDARALFHTDIYVQRLNGAGTALWTPGGVVLSDAPLDQAASSLAPDGAGGAIVAWVTDTPSGQNDLYAQRVNGLGVPQWATGGVPVCTEPGSQYDPRISSDLNGGAIVAWHDLRTGIDYDVYAQRLKQDGTVAWASGGVAVSAGPGDQVNYDSVSDGAGGVIVSLIVGPFGAYDLYAQRLDGQGTLLWGPGGAAICVAPSHQFFGQAVNDGAGGMVVTWSDFRNGITGDAYAQRISATGVTLWAVDGIPVSQGIGDQLGVAIVGDGTGNTIVGCLKGQSAEYDVYAQRITAAGR